MKAFGISSVSIFILIDIQEYKIMNIEQNIRRDN